jgi:hypothetical protein
VIFLGVQSGARREGEFSWLLKSKSEYGELSLVNSGCRVQKGFRIPCGASKKLQRCNELVASSEWLMQASRTAKAATELLKQLLNVVSSS